MFLQMKEPAPTEQNSDISQKLRSLYEAVQEEAIPDKFLDLLEKLDQAEQASRSTSDDH
ncbi:NepR family anti-sigma factor [Notoacmeibacter marinus]|uniref:NepR family anti-sigma factor n=2 Tax=Notoacmeibacter marinus TaxID=1876515 RepID=UPI001303367C|nr:NepR family anti-sigma factor [Notoacmeibacter marinus]